MYKVEILVEKFVPEHSYKKEIVKFFSLFTARCKARDYASCNDVENVDVIDEETGEVMLSLNYNGEVVWDSEG